MDLRQFAKALEASPGGIHFLNTTIIPPGSDGTWIVEEVNATAVRSWLSGMAHAGEVDFAQSHIGHEATAQVASELFGVELAMDRTPWDGRGVAVALQLRGRLPEGQILGREELEAMGYTVRALYRIAPAPVIENDWNGKDEVDAVALRSLGPRADRSPAWTTEALRKDLVEAMGMHGKAELAVERVLPKLLSMLWEAHELNLKRIDELRRDLTEVASAQEETHAEPGDIVQAQNGNCYRVHGTEGAFLRVRPWDVAAKSEGKAALRIASAGLQVVGFESGPLA